MPSSRGSTHPRDWTHKSLCLLHWQAGSLPLVPPGKPDPVALAGLIEQSWRPEAKPPPGPHSSLVVPGPESTVPIWITSTWALKVSSRPFPLVFGPLSSLFTIPPVMTGPSWPFHFSPVVSGVQPLRPQGWAVAGDSGLIPWPKLLSQWLPSRLHGVTFHDTKDLC